MDNIYNPDTLYQKYITTVTMSDFDFIIHYAERLNGSTIEFLHYHPLYEIYYVTSGCLHIFVHDRELTVKEGEVLYIAPNINHHVFYEPSSQKEYFVLIFDFVSKVSAKSPFGALEYREIKMELDLIRRENYVLINEPFEGNYILNKIWEEMKEKKIGWTSVANTLFYQFFIMALRHINRKSSLQKVPDGTLNMGLEASKYIHMNYQKEITIESVANHLNIAPRHVNRVFQSLFGTTFSRTLSVLRMEYAKNYFCNTDYSIEKVANLVGFSSPKTLHRLFKEFEGMSISEYKKKYKTVISDKKGND